MLIGVETYEDEELHDLPAALDNVKELRKILWSDTVGLPKSNVKREIDLKSRSDFENKLYDLIEGNEIDTLIIYYSGHGILDDNDLFYLSFSETKVGRVQSHGLRIRNLSEILEGNNFNIILILDCCFSEKAFEEFEQRNFYLIASSPKNKTSKYPLNEEHSAFTQELIKILEEGIDNDQKSLSLNNIYEALKTRLKSNGFPEPKRTSSNEVGDLWITKNKFDVSRRLGTSDKEYLNKLFIALSKYDPSLIEKNNNLSQRSSNYLKEFKKLILDAYPSVISYQLKNLMPNQPGVNANYIKKFYYQIVQFLNYILVADIQRQASPSQELLNQIEGWKNFDHKGRLNAIKNILKIKNNYFIKELSEKKIDLLSAINLLEELGEPQKNDLEKWMNQLISLLSELGFLTNYNLASIRFIDVEKRLIKPDKFKHEVSVLRGESPKNYGRTVTFATGYLHSNCVVLFKEKKIDQINESSEYLNLWPLLIDVNSFSPENNTPEIHFFQKKENNAYWYKEVNLWKEITLRDYQSLDKSMTLEEQERQFAAFEKNLE